jgi:hypothetical protein
MAEPTLLRMCAIAIATTSAMWIPHFPLEQMLKRHTDETAAAAAAMASTLATQTQIAAGFYKLRLC